MLYYVPSVNYPQPMQKYLIILLLIVGCVFAREYIAIIDFEGIGVSDTEAKALTQRLTSEMIALEVYQLVERSEMKRLLDEQKFQYSGCVDMKCAVEIGKLIGAKYMVVGSVSKVGSTYSIDSRLISVETGESYISALYDFTGEIDILLKSGMKNIARQLCELEDAPIVTNTPIPTQTIIKESKSTYKHRKPFSLQSWLSKDIGDYLFNTSKNDYYFTLIGFGRRVPPNVFSDGNIAHFRYKNIQVKMIGGEFCEGTCFLIDSNNDTLNTTFDETTYRASGIGYFKKLNSFLGLNIWYYFNGGYLYGDNQNSVDLRDFYEISLQVESPKYYFCGV